MQPPPGKIETRRRQQWGTISSTTACQLLRRAGSGAPPVCNREARRLRYELVKVWRTDSGSTGLASTLFQAAYRGIFSESTELAVQAPPDEVKAVKTSQLVYDIYQPRKQVAFPWESTYVANHRLDSIYFCVLPNERPLNKTFPGGRVIVGLF